MSTWTTPRTWLSGILTSAAMNEIRDNLGYLKDVVDLHGMTSSTARASVKTRRYGVRLTNSADITVPDSTDKVLTWDNEDVDSASLHSTTSAARVTIPSGGDGDYQVGASVRWVSNSTGYRQLWFETFTSAGTTRYGVDIRQANGQSAHTTSTYIPNLAAGDYITCNVRQTSGGNLDVGLSAGAGQCFWALRQSST